MSSTIDLVTHAKLEQNVVRTMLKFGKGSSATPSIITSARQIICLLRAKPRIIGAAQRTNLYTGSSCVGLRCLRRVFGGRTHAEPRTNSTAPFECLKQLLRSTKHSVELNMFSFTLDELKNIPTELFDKGVKVRVKICKTLWNELTLRNIGSQSSVVASTTAFTSGCVHNEIVVDGRFDWSNCVAFRNYVHLVVCKDRELAAAVCQVGDVHVVISRSLQFYCWYCNRCPSIMTFVVMYVSRRSVQMIWRVQQSRFVHVLSTLCKTA